MSFELKDLIYFVMFSGSIVTLFLTFSNRVNNVETAIGLLKNIVFKKSGELALMTTDACNKREVDIQKAIDRSTNDIADMRKEIHEMSQNILVIMVHLNIDTESVKIPRKVVSNGKR